MSPSPTSSLFLDRLPAAPRVVFASLGEVTSYAPNTTIVFRGAVDTHLFLVESGTVEVLRDGEPPLHLEAGQLVGEMAFVDGSYRRNTIAAHTHVVARRITREELERGFAGDAQGLAAVMEAIRLLREERLSGDPTPGRTVKPPQEPEVKEDPALKWDLSDLYASPGDSRLHDDLGRGVKLARAFAEAWRGKVAKLGPGELHQALRQYEALMEAVYRPAIYAQLLFSADTSNAEAQGLLAKTREVSTEAFNEVAFFDVELKKLSGAQHLSLLAAPQLQGYRHYLAGLKKLAPYTLSEAEEQLAATKALTGKSAWGQLYTEVTGRLRVHLVVDGERKTFNVAEARALRSSPDRALRRAATDGLMVAFEQESHVLNFCFNTLFQDHKLDVETRGFKTVTDPTYLDDELSEAVVESLMQATEAHYGLAQRYMKLKARALGLPDFSSHDVLAPLLPSEQKVSFEDGKAMVLDAFGAFHPRFAEIAREFFDRRWLDVMPRPGKRDGAFCSGGLPSTHPYVLLNYQGRIEDVSTTAHELGHGIHFYLSREKSPLNFWPTTSLAETASVFGELLLMKRLLDKEQDRAARRALVGVRIEDIVSTVFNQVAYTRFEQKAHARRGEGVVPVEDFNALWTAERQRLYGDAVKLFPQDRWGWLSIGHFVHYRFYCYSYAFGQLLVLALFAKYEEEGEAFLPKYVELLSSGCSDTPEVLLSRMGVDVADPGFWSRGFRTLSALLDEFESLL
jgi:oligoendopeptidase F